MTCDVYMHFPVIAIMTFFVGAFIVTLCGSKEKIRNVVAGLAVLIPLTLLALLIKPVMVDGEIIVYWMGNWEPVEGYAIGIAIEVDALSLFFHVRPPVPDRDFGFTRHRPEPLMPGFSCATIVSESGRKINREVSLWKH